MLKIIFTVTLVYVLTSSALPDPNQNYEFPNFGPPQIRRAKPCNSNRKSSTDDFNEWIPTYTSQVVKPSSNVYTNFKPESLKDDNIYQKEVEVEPVLGILTDHRNVDDNNQVNTNKDENLAEDVLLQEKTNLNKEHITTKVTKQTKSKKKLSDADVEKGEEITQLFNSKPFQSNKVNKVEFENADNAEPEERQAINSDNFNDESVQKKAITEFKQSDVENVKEDSKKEKQSNKCIEVKEGFVANTEENSDEEESDEDNLSDPASRKVYGNIRDPTAGAGVSAMGAAGVNILQHTRVCYACSSLSNPKCFQPDRLTTVKYCRPGQNACVTKRFDPLYGQALIVRDCANSCSDDYDGPRPRTCKICHTDLCNDDFVNGAFSINSQSLMISLFVAFIVKYSI